MKLHENLLKAAALGMLGLGSQLALAAPNPPVPVDSTPFVIPANSSFYACTFDLRVEYLGKSKTINLPGGRFVSASKSPGLFVKLTNVSNESKTVTLNITGSISQSLDDYGNFVYKATGRNLLGDPTTGLVLVIGDFSYVFDSSNVNLVKPLSGNGRMLPICPMVE